ncbi:hypothetical protein BJ742DRAFT_822297 [Cladochytrium replicatum]|nr:hypothetical protein BJ742DRAFT_822297 [Cladochytrium replicatum]
MLESVYQCPPLPEDLVDSQAKQVLHAHVASHSVGAFTILTTTGTILSTTVRKFRVPLFTALLRNNAAALAAGLVAGVVMTEGRMQGKETIEWQDRSWRLLNSAKQNAVDDGIYSGAAAGALVAAVATRRVGLATRILGGSGLGGGIGFATSMFLVNQKKTDKQ